MLKSTVLNLHNQTRIVQESSNAIGKRETNVIPYIWLWFFIWPLLGFLFAWYHIRKKDSRYIIISFYALYGLLYVINPLMDGARRADRLSEAHQESLSKAFFYINNLYESTVDFLDPIIIYLVSRFTDFHGLLFGVYAVIFGILSLKFIQTLSARYSVYPMNKNAVLFLVLLVWINFISEIGGFRMWCAAWIFSLGTLYYVLKREFKYLLFAGIAVFLHFSFIPIAILLLLYHFLRDRPKLYGIIAIGTLFINDIDIALFQSYSSNLGTALETKVAAYTNESYIKDRVNAQKHYVWFLKIGPQLMLYFTYACLSYVYYTTKGLTKDQLFNGLFSLSLLFLAFSNISGLLPSGGRFKVIFYTFAFATLFIYYLKFERRQSLKLLNWAGLPFALLYVLIKFRIATDTISLYLIAPSIFLPFGLYDSVPLKDFLF